MQISHYGAVCDKDYFANTMDFLHTYNYIYGYGVLVNIICLIPNNLIWYMVWNVGILIHFNSFIGKIYSVLKSNHQQNASCTITW